ncbi:hypothetical protein PanWU01x14_035570 [Parasponia andersonii]|uniref:Uncharacterized protein n=1 Tax=Parasponia andersonii TaxID=3476 RepID=A0A2P5DT81_PARAD|nr:hypothetical protein PanWU01x14_035570 [Parasponia andersonii]
MAKWAGWPNPSCPKRAWEGKRVSLAQPRILKIELGQARRLARALRQARPGPA